MAQMTIYLPDAIEKRARRAARAEGKSVSRWIADRVLQDLETAWPKGVLEAAGAIPDFPDLDELRSSYGADAAREPIE